MRDATGLPTRPSNARGGGTAVMAPLGLELLFGIEGGNLSGLNEEIIWCSIILSIIIAVLITVALCYLAREKCKKRNEYLAAT
ncbi:unnamed protein product [Nesidiocoris tenuis]|uniref:Uncharacterized protein n=1 Tax=Nesidiocoris tenuis TaxID=355587 RepID=A0A6H5HQC7_9HEMI|nr:unnamed protein product [Nesidiocoris tenuis]CAB0020245.1 unnamed protein product [Nesidiocoris tenuis]